MIRMIMFVAFCVGFFIFRLIRNLGNYVIDNDGYIALSCDLIHYPINYIIAGLHSLMHVAIICPIVYFIFM